MALSLLETLIRHLARLPGLGPRSARRLAFHLIKEKNALIPPLVDILMRASQGIATCPQCGNLDEQSPCGYCTDTQRDRAILCVVEDIADLWALEGAGCYKGVYHVLGGTLSALDGRGPEELGIDKVLNRLVSGNFQEVILALNPTLEGQTTSQYVTDRIRSFPELNHLRLSHLACGIPLGGELDYLDRGTLMAALEERKTF